MTKNMFEKSTCGDHWILQASMIEEVDLMHSGQSSTASCCIWTTKGWTNSTINIALDPGNRLTRTTRTPILRCFPSRSERKMKV